LRIGKQFASGRADWFVSLPLSCAYACCDVLSYFLYFSSYITDDENVLLFRTRIPRQLDDFFISLLLLLLARLSCVGDEPSSLFPPLKKKLGQQENVCRY
jgi:hypothetical protein